MSENLFNQSPLLEHLHSNQVVLTPNSRLRRMVVDAYNHSCQEANRPAWKAPRVYAYSEWVVEMYQQLLDCALTREPKVIANDHQLQQLWLQVISSDDSGAELINPMRLASDANSASKTLQRWRLDASQLQEHSDSEQLLSRWLKLFRGLLSSQGFCTLEDAQEEIIYACLNGHQNKERHLILLGFEQPAPLLTQLVSAAATSYTSSPALQRDKADFCMLASCASTEEEVQAAALWALSLLQQNPDSSIAIISPDLGQSRDLIERIFIEVFEPHYNLPETPRYTLPFNFSAGTPLGKVPLIHDALELLKLNLTQWAVEKLIDLLNSPFWMISGLSDLQQQITTRVRLRNRETIRTAQLRHICHSLVLSAAENESVALDESAANKLDQCLQRFETLRQQQPFSLRPGQWAELFEQQLKTLGWPGERRLDSNEFQQMNHWYVLLEQFCLFDQTQGAIGSQKALDLLSQLSISTPFQAQTPKSPIQILGILEGAGLAFDHCWVLGMSQNNWPPAPEPNPLIPLALQREKGMPHADANRELIYAEQLTNSYRRSAANVIFSYSNFEDGTTTEASSLLNELESFRPVEEPWYCQSGWQQHCHAQLGKGHFQWLNCSTAPEVSPGELKRIRGGSQILKDQAALPASAFFYHRLGAEKEQTVSTGLTPLQRGQILHDSLADIWLQLENHHNLMNTPAEQLKRRVSNTVTEHIKKVRNREPLILGERYMALETLRQTRLILEWLELEKTRPPFTVKAIEESLKVNFAGLPLNLRLDRLDQMETGELVLIDYKTGKPSAKSWAGNRLEEPQLPLYCLCFDSEIKAIMFAQINTESTQTIGLGELSSYHDGFLNSRQIARLELPSDWSAILDFWQSSLNNLVDEFINGDSSYNLTSPSQARFYESLTPLLRWPETDEITQAFAKDQGATK